MALIRIIDDLDRSLHVEGEILDRESITKWLMQFSAGLPLRLHHPVMGDIAYQGIRFAGSPVLVFDRYVGLTIEDYIERHVRMIEDAMANIDQAHLQKVAIIATGRLASARQRLRAKAASIKGRLSEAPGLVPLSPPANPINVAARLNARVEEIRGRLPPPARPPVWGWLEDFAKRNPALSNLASFAVGAILSAIGILIALRH